jgi:glycosyltransferase A (GT-A) superfamily protein (DUF2064 family)
MKLSIIIPVGKEETNFHLIQQIRNQFVDSEIILVCDSKFDRKNLASISYHQLLFIDNSTRAKALNEGSRCAKYSYLWFLHLDSNINNITPKDVERLEDNQLYYFSLAFENSLNTFNAIGANYRSKLLSIPFGDQGFLMSKKLFFFIGMFNEAISRGEDHEFIWRAKSLEVAITMLNKTIITSSRKYVSNNMSQTLLTIWRTIIQIIQFRKTTIKTIYLFFSKDPLSTQSKTRLRKETDDYFVNEFNALCLSIMKENIMQLQANKTNKIVIVNNGNDNSYIERLGLSNVGMMNIFSSELGISMKDAYDFSLGFVDQVVLTGSDIPEITHKILEKTADLLPVNNNIFYPTYDGGFCIYATKEKKVETIFTSVRYGLQTTLRDFVSHLTNYQIINNFLHDIDTLQDVKQLYQKWQAANNLSEKQKEMLSFLKNSKYIA